MAESQVPYAYSPEKLAAIRANLSEARFASYLSKAGGHEEYAIGLYLYNARVAKAFLYPLHVVEVTVRNAIDEILVQLYGSDWHINAAFVTGILNADGQSTLAKAISRVGDANRNQVVAALTFDFWSHMLRPEYGAVWRTKLNIAFPGIPGGQTRHDVQQMVRAINQFRNRVAHHEPVLDLNILDVHAKILTLVSWRNSHAANWLRHFSTVSTITRQRPTLAGSARVLLSSRADPNFVVCTPTETVFQILERMTDRTPAIVSVDVHNTPLAAFTSLDLVRFVAAKAALAEGMVDLNDHTIDAIIDGAGLDDKWTALEQGAPLTDAIAALKGPRVKVVVACDEVTNAPTGVIVRAHRRY